MAEEKQNHCMAGIPKVRKIKDKAVNAHSYLIIEIVKESAGMITMAR